MAILIFGKSISLVIEWSLEESLYLEGVVLFSEGEDHPLIFLATDDESDILVISKDNLDFVEWFTVCHQLILSIDNLHIILIKTFLVLLVSLLEYHYNKIVILELLYYPLYSLNVVDFYLLSWSILIYVLVISLEADQHVTISHDLHQLHLILHNPLPLAQILKPEEVLFIWVIQICLIQSSCQFYLLYLLFI